MQHGHMNVKFGYVLLGSCHMHIFMPSFGGVRVFFAVSVTRCIVTEMSA